MTNEIDSGQSEPRDQESSPWAAYRPPERTNLKVGGVVSTVYVSFFVIYALIELEAFLKMTPDQFAEFLAGVFAPLAFLWLVLGFMQQGEELRQSSHALWLQGEELRNSVEQQRQLVAAQKDQLAFDRERLEADRAEIKRQAQPELVFTGGGHTTDSNASIMFFKVLNRGRTCTDVRLEIEGSRFQWPLFESGTNRDTNIRVPFDAAVGLRAYTATFIDGLGNKGSQQLLLEAVHVHDRTVLRLVE